MSSQTTYELVSLLMTQAVADHDRAAAFRELVARPIDAENLREARHAMRERMTPVALADDAIDTCGTGGSGKKTVNTSTLAAFVTAAAGGKVAKHGNRSAGGNCGAFDLLERLGAKIDLSPDEERRIFDRLGIVFLYAPRHHPAMRLTAPLRKAHGRPTLFNFLGPLLNPAGVRRQLIGVGSQETATVFAECLRLDAAERIVLATGHDGLDEVTVTAPTTIRTVSEGRIVENAFYARPIERAAFFRS